MKRVLLIAFLLVLLLVHVSAQDSLSQADDAYRRGDFITAIALYETALLNGEQSGALYFNLGNAYYQAGNQGHALLNYRRAALYLPRDPDIALQINRIRAERQDPYVEDSDWLILTASISTSMLTNYEMSILLFASWILFFILLAFSIKRRFWRAPMIVTGIILLMGLLLFAARIYVETQRPPAVILNSLAQVWSGPGEDYLPLFTIYEAAEIRVLEEQDNWIRFALPNGQQGWILKESVGYITG